VIFHRNAQRFRKPRLARSGEYRFAFVCRYAKGDLMNPYYPDCILHWLVHGIFRGTGEVFRRRRAKVSVGVYVRVPRVLEWRAPLLLSALSILRDIMHERK
jgi:hypothetical protein